MKTRCSSLPLLTKCPAAGVEPAVKRLSGGPEASLGTCVHEILASWVNAGQPGDIEDAVRLAGETVDPDEASMLARMAWRCWERLRDYFPEPKTEAGGTVRIGWVELSGHLDVLSVTPDQVRIVDWKSGREDGDFSAQLKGYAAVALAENPNCTSAYVALVRVRDQQIDAQVFTREQIESWAQQLPGHLDKADAYNPGEWCGRCGRFYECPARDGWIRGTIAVLEDVSLNGITTERRGTFWANALGGAKMLADLAEQIREQVRAEVLAAGGKLPTDDGRELVLIGQDQRKIVPALAWEALREELTEETLLECVKIGKGDVETALKANAPRGHKGRIVQEFFGRLEEAGAITIQRVERLECRRSAPKVPEVTHEHANAAE